MKLLIDANVLLDVLAKREPHYEDSSKVWKLCEAGRAEGCISALTFANIVYVLRRQLSAERVDDVARMLGLIFTWVDLTGSDVEEAAALRWPDYEDALQALAARRISADYIVTRNVKDFSESPIQAVTPRQFLAAAIENDGIPFPVGHRKNDRLAQAIEDVRLRRNLYGPFESAEEAVASMLED